MKSFKYIALLLIGTLFFSCKEDFFTTIVEVELPTIENTLVVNSIVRADKPFNFQLYKAVEVLDNEAQSTLVENGVIEIYEGEQLLETVTPTTTVNVDTFVNWPNLDTVIYTNTRITYDSETIAETGKTYEIKASAPDFEPVTAVSAIPNKPVIKTIYISDTVEVVDFYGYKDEKIELTIEMEDDINTEDYYYINLSSKEFFTDPYTGDEFNYKNSICYESYDPIFNSVETDPVDVEAAAWYCGLADFNDNLFNGKTKKFTLLIDTYYFNNNYGNQNSERFINVDLGHTTKDFYLYARSATSQSWNDGNPFAEPVTVYSNIENGFGIFAGISEISITLE